MQQAFTVYEKYRFQVPSNNTSSESFIVRKLNQPEARHQTVKSDRSETSRVAKSSVTFSRNLDSNVAAPEVRGSKTRAASAVPTTTSTRKVKFLRQTKPKKRTRSRSKSQKLDTSSNFAEADSATELISSISQKTLPQLQKSESNPTKTTKNQTKKSKTNKLEGRPRPKSAAVSPNQKHLQAPLRSQSCLGYPVVGSLHVDSDVINAVGAANTFEKSYDLFDRYLQCKFYFLFTCSNSRTGAWRNANRCHFQLRVRSFRLTHSAFLNLL